jgi:hypothetical protein
VLWLRCRLNIFEPNSSANYVSDESNRSPDHISDVEISDRQSDESNRDPDHETNRDPDPLSDQTNPAPHCCAHTGQCSIRLRYVERTDLDHHGQLGHADNFL